MTAYILIRVNVTDMDQYIKYTKLSAPAVAAFDGKFLARGGETVTLEGPDVGSERVVILEFPSLERAQEFYHSDMYKEAMALRKDVATASFIAVDGVA